MQTSLTPQEQQEYQARLTQARTNLTDSLSRLVPSDSSRAFTSLLLKRAGRDDAIGYEKAAEIAAELAEHAPTFPFSKHTGLSDREIYTIAGGVIAITQEPLLELMATMQQWEKTEPAIEYLSQLRAGKTHHDESLVKLVFRSLDELSRHDNRTIGQTQFTALKKHETIWKYLDRMTSQKRLGQYFKRWYRRSMEEFIQAHCGEIVKYASPLASNARMRDEIKRQEFCENFTVLNLSRGKLIELPEVETQVIAARAEMNERARGLAKYAEHLGLDPVMITITAPSHMHANSKHYDGSTPSEVQRWLKDTWKKFLDALTYRDIIRESLRVPEPHKDMTPHWHGVLWVAPEHQEEAHQLLHDLFIGKDETDPARLEHGLQFDPIEVRDGSRTGTKSEAVVSYLVKYVQKYIHQDNLKPEYITAGDTGSDNLTEAKAEDSDFRRVRSWYSIHGIRNFQFSNSGVTAYRQLRRLGKIDDNGQFHIKKNAGPVPHALLKPIEDAVRADYFNHLLNIDELGLKPLYEDSEPDEHGQTTRRVTGVKWTVDGIEQAFRIQRDEMVLAKISDLVAYLQCGSKEELHRIATAGKLTAALEKRDAEMSVTATSSPDVDSEVTVTEPRGDNPTRIFIDVPPGFMPEDLEEDPDPPPWPQQTINFNRN